MYARINHQIKSNEVRLIDYDGTQIGIVSNYEALKKAEERGLDLIEISPQAVPPVCKIMGFDKFKYEIQQKQKKAKKKLKEVEIKEFRLKLNIFKTDLETRLERMNEFLKKGDKIKVTIVFRGRENHKKELGYELAGKIINYFGDRIEVEKEPMKQGSLMTFTFGLNYKK